MPGEVDINTVRQQPGQVYEMVGYMVMWDLTPSTGHDADYICCRAIQQGFGWYLGRRLSSHLLCTEHACFSGQILMLYLITCLSV